MIFDALIPALEERFPGRGMCVAGGRPALAHDRSIDFPAVHPEVGDVVVWDDGDEATVCIGAITHGHFNEYGEGPTTAEREASIVRQVVGFLDALFSNRVLLRPALGGSAGGWRLVDAPPEKARPSWIRRWYLWSGPLSQ